jgi:hypothetical protein
VASAGIEPATFRFSGRVVATPLCFDWSRRVGGSELVGLEHVVRAFGPIFAPWVSGRGVFPVNETAKF